MHLAIKKHFQSDETQVLIAGIAKLIFGLCYSVNFGPGWLLNVDAPPPIRYRSIRTLQTEIIWLKIIVKTLKGPTRATLQIRTFLP